MRNGRVVILNEEREILTCLDTKNLGKHPGKKVALAARYYKEQGLSGRELEAKLTEVVAECIPGANLGKWTGFIERLAKSKHLNPLVRLDYVGITQSEINTIKMLPTIRERRLAFTLAALAHYWYAVKPEAKGWVFSTDEDVGKMCGLHLTVDAKCQLYYRLQQKGLITLASEIDSMAVKVEFADFDGEPVLKITDFRGVGLQWDAYAEGVKTLHCERCGVIVRRNCNSQKFCKACAKVAKAEWNAHRYIKGSNDDSGAHLGSIQ